MGMEDVSAFMRLRFGKLLHPSSLILYIPFQGGVAKW